MAGVMAAVVLSACDATGPKTPEALTALPRALTARETAVIEATNGFSIELFKRVSAAESGKNVFISPLSASMALGMTMNGARNGTLDAMRAALQFGDLPQGDINASYQSLISLLSGLDPSTQMDIANSIWLRKTFAVDPDFVAATQTFFNAEVTTLDFDQEEAAKSTINAWVNARTNGRIPSIVEEISPADKAFLINAIYFKGAWRFAFNPANTREAPFTPASGPVQTARMMRLEKAKIVSRHLSDGTQMGELPYGNTAFNMVLVLPPPGQSLDAFIAQLSKERWGELTEPAPPTELDVYLPRLRLEYKRLMNPDLAALGMGVAFTDAADFSGMYTSGPAVAISRVLQKTFVEINEEGTEAAAVTEVAMFDSLPPSIMCNRPYLIVIRERFSGTIVFIGKINTM